MTPKTFFTVVLKIMGLVYIVEMLIVLPSFFSSVYSLMSPTYSPGLDMTSIAIASLIAMIVILFFVIIIRSFLFKTTYLIDKLKLEKNFTEEKIDVNLSFVSIITIASIVAGAIIAVDSLPLLCRNVFSALQNLRQYAFITDNPSMYYVIENGVKLVIGYLLINNARQIAKWTEKKQEPIDNANH